MNVKSMAAEIRESWPAEHTLHLDFSGKVFRIETNSKALDRELWGYFGDFVTGEAEPVLTITAHEAPEPRFWTDYSVKPPEPGKTRIKEEYADVEGGRIVRKRLTGMHFIFGGDTHLAVGPCEENPNQVINFINNRFIGLMLNEGCLLGHAAAVEYEGQGLALAGFSGAGKSTLALHLMSRGANFISNDRLMVRERPGGGLDMYGVAKLPRINPGTALGNPDLYGVIPGDEREAFLALRSDELWTLEHKYDVFIDQCFGPGRFLLEVPMTGLVILNWRRGEGRARAMTVEPRSRKDLLPAFMKSEGLFYLDDRGGRDTSEGAYAELLGRCAVVEITGGVNFDYAVAVCMDILAGKTPGGHS